MQILIRLLKVLLSILWFPLGMVAIAIIMLILCPIALVLYVIGYILFGPNEEFDFFDVMVLFSKVPFLPYFLIWEGWEEVEEILRD